MDKKKNRKQKTFQENAHMQGSKKVPLPQTKEYGTGCKYKKAAAPLANKNKMRNSK